MPLGPHSFTPAELTEQLAADRIGRPYLVLRDAELRMLLVPLEGERITIGRERGNDIVVHWDGEVSRVHSQLERVGGRWAAGDDGLSRNGTFVGGARLVGRRRLSDGDLLRCGQTELLFRDPGAVTSETIPAGDAVRAAHLTGAQRRILVALCRPVAATSSVAAPASNKEIADALHLSVDGVRSQLKTLFLIFDVGGLPQHRKRAELVRLALETGVVTRADLDG